ncbi:MAG: hypothetical protein ACRELA_21460 [Candidatus Rokuibacteriota bacterium]
MRVAQRPEGMGFDSLWVFDRTLSPVIPKAPYPIKDGILPIKFRNTAPGRIVHEFAGPARPSSDRTAVLAPRPAMHKNDLLGEARMDVLDRDCVASLVQPARVQRVDLVNSESELDGIACPF